MLLTTKEAASLLGIQTYQLTYSVRKGQIVPDRQVGGTYLFDRERLLAWDRAKDARRGPRRTDDWPADWLTLQEAAAYMGITELAFRYRLYETKDIQPAGKHRGRLYFIRGKLSAIMSEDLPDVSHD